MTMQPNGETIRAVLNQAVKAAQDACASQEVSTIALTGEAWAVFQCVPENAGIIRAIHARAMGTFYPIDLTYIVSADELADGISDRLAIGLRTINAFVEALDGHGFKVATRTITSVRELLDE